MCSDRRVGKVETVERPRRSLERAQYELVEHGQLCGQVRVLVRVSKSSRAACVIPVHSRLQTAPISGVSVRVTSPSAM